MRKGREGTREGSTDTTLEILDTGPPLYSDHVATYDEKTGEWRRV